MRLIPVVPLALVLLTLLVRAGDPPDEAQMRGYVDAFNGKDEELIRQDIPNAAAADFLAENIPFFDAPDEDFVRTYYFRWWVFRKHIKSTPVGCIITEFLPPVRWAGEHNAISCSLGHHLFEGRWLRDRRYLDQYLGFWLTKTAGEHLRAYSSWLGEGIWARHLVQPDRELLIGLLPSLVRNYEGWEKTNLCEDGLFFQTDRNDGMEHSISGPGRRPTLNSYLYGDAKVIARIARMAGRPELAAIYREKADSLRQRVLGNMWDGQAGFFKTLPGREGDQKAEVRELLGYTPWLVGLPGADEVYGRAWNRLMDEAGFFSPYGPTTAERCHPRFEAATKYPCQWNGPSWPYATSVTLQALANALHAGNSLPVGREAYFKTLSIYTCSQRRAVEGGTAVPWIDENLNPLTGEWLARELRRKNREPFRELGKDYNHSSYCDLIISGLVGLVPREDDRVEIDPLLPPGEWDYFCLTRVSYHGRDLTVLWDRDGTRYGRGKGLRLWVDGRPAASRPDLGKLATRLPPN